MPHVRGTRYPCNRWKCWQLYTRHSSRCVPTTLANFIKTRGARASPKGSLVNWYVFFPTRNARKRRNRMWMGTCQYASWRSRDANQFPFWRVYTWATETILKRSEEMWQKNLTWSWFYYSLLQYIFWVGQHRKRQLEWCRRPSQGLGIKGGISKTASRKWKGQARTHPAKENERKRGKTQAENGPPLHTAKPTRHRGLGKPIKTTRAGSSWRESSPMRS